MIVKIIVCSLVCVIISLILKQYKPEFVPLVLVSSVIVLIALIIGDIKQIFEDFYSLIPDNEFLNDGYLIILIKVLLIAVLSKFASDFCRDSGFSVIASNIELVGKVLMLSFTLPIIKVIVELLQGLLV